MSSVAQWAVLQHRNVLSDFSFIVIEERETQYPLLVYTDLTAKEYVGNNPDCDLLLIVSWYFHGLMIVHIQIGLDRCAVLLGVLNTYMTVMYLLQALIV